MERDEENHRAFEQAQQSCPPGHMVCSTLAEDGRPLYFHVPEDATDDVVRDTAFSVRNGRPMSDYERTALAEAERMRG